MTDPVRALEAESIRRFVADNGPYMGRVLDYGSGRQPYADLLAADAAIYVGYDDPAFPASVAAEPSQLRDPLAHWWNFIVCTQVIQYVPDVPALLRSFHDCLLSTRGLLVLTGPSSWPEVEPQDLHRFTRAGTTRLLQEAGFVLVEVEERAHVEIHGARFSLGWGAVAYA